VRKDGRLVGRKGYITGMEEAHETGKKLSHSAYANVMK
jgi:hypothetical protein